MYHILTHPTTFNYGGILQAYALQRVLFETEYNADTIEYNAQGQIKQNSKGIYRSIRKLLASFCSLAGICNKQVPFTLVACFHQIFKKRFVRLMPLDNARHKLSQLQDDSPFIVGSDQVWRRQYARPIESLPFFFLDFATQKQRQRSIAYAASFGSDEWEGTPGETGFCIPPFKQGDYIQALQQLMQDNHLWLQMSRKNVEHAAQFTIGRVVAKWLDLFQSLTSR